MNNIINIGFFDTFISLTFKDGRTEDYTYVKRSDERIYHIAKPNFSMRIVGRLYEFYNTQERLVVRI